MYNCFHSIQFSFTLILHTASVSRQLCFTFLGVYIFWLQMSYYNINFHHICIKINNPEISTNWEIERKWAHRRFQWFPLENKQGFRPFIHTLKKIGPSSHDIDDFFEQSTCRLLMEHISHRLARLLSFLKLQLRWKVCLICLIFLLIAIKLKRKARCMDPKWSPISELTMVLVAWLHSSDNSLSLPSLLGHACIVHKLGILLSIP